MSQWSHINGIVRIDDLRVGGMSQLAKIKEALGEPTTWEDYNEVVWDNCKLPKGSEGSIDYTIWVNPETSSVASYTVSFFGDLRDYEDEKAVEKWFKGFLDSCWMIRQAVLQMEIEYQRTVIFYIEDKGWDAKKKKNKIVVKKVVIPWPKDRI